MSAEKTGMNTEFLKKLTLFEEKLKKAGIRVMMTDGFRSPEEQDKLYARGRTIPGRKITNARGGYSWHNFGLAADYAFIVNGKVTWNGPWQTFGRIAKECGLEWGGNFKSITDRPHVQWTQGKTLSQMRQAKHP